MSTNDPEFYQAPKFTPEPPQPAFPRQRGCFFYGCIIAGVLALLMAILVSVALYFGFRYLGQQVENYTSTAPRELPKVEMPAEQRQALKDQVEAFRKAVEAGTPIEPLVLTSDDLNALIEEDDDLKGRIHVKLEGDEVKGLLSLPLDALAQGPFRSMFQGRYLNGEADLKASLKDGVLIVTLDQIEVNGKKPPDEFMTQLRQQNLAKDAYKNPKHAEMIRKLDSLEVKDGKIILRVRAKPAEKSGTASDKAELPVEVVAPAKKEAPAGETTKKTDPPKDDESKTTPEPAAATSATPKT
jgi:hypothetical protein